MPTERSLKPFPNANLTVHKRKLAVAAARRVDAPSIPKPEVVLPEVTLASVPINPDIVNIRDVLDFDLEAYIHTLGLARYPRRPKPLPLFWDCSYNCRVKNNKQRPPDFLFESPVLVKRFPEKLDDYKPSTIKSKTINHFFTYSRFRQRALEYPTLMDNIAYIESWIPKSMDPGVRLMDDVLNYLLGYLDQIVPYEYRSIHPAYLSPQQRKVKELTVEQRNRRNKEIFIILLLIPILPVYLLVITIVLSVASLSIFF